MTTDAQPKTVPCLFCKGRPGRSTCPTCHGAGEVDEAVRAEDMAAFWTGVFAVVNAGIAENASSSDQRKAA